MTVRKASSPPNRSNKYGVCCCWCWCSSRLFVGVGHVSSTSLLSSVAFGAVPNQDDREEESEEDDDLVRRVENEDNDNEDRREKRFLRLCTSTVNRC